jgi:hypothetical protein
MGLTAVSEISSTLLHAERIRTEIKIVDAILVFIAGLGVNIAQITPLFLVFSICNELKAAY